MYGGTRCIHSLRPPYIAPGATPPTHHPPKFQHANPPTRQPANPPSTQTPTRQPANPLTVQPLHPTLVARGRSAASGSNVRGDHLGRISDTGGSIVSESTRVGRRPAHAGAAQPMSPAPHTPTTPHSHNPALPHSHTPSNNSRWGPRRPTSRPTRPSTHPLTHPPTRLAIRPIAATAPHMASTTST